ncbi:AMP-binding protein, partial [Streptomyces tricolor]|nr:AMP-binding protein [Streptomyces tricolor]
GAHDGTGQARGGPGFRRVRDGPLRPGDRRRGRGPAGTAAAFGDHRPVPAAQHPRRALPDERDRILTRWNATAHAVPDTTLPELFQAQAARTPQAIAVQHDDATLTYAELNTRANRLAHHLIGRGIGPEQYVALALPRSVNLVVAVLAVPQDRRRLPPLDPDYPADRITYMLGNSTPACLLTDHTTAATLPTGQGPTHLLLDHHETATALAAHPDHDPTDSDRVTALRPAHPAYVIYTSGSTGRPKGVVVEHHSLNHYLAWARHTYPTMTDRALVHSPVAFDLTVTGLLGPPHQRRHRPPHRTQRPHPTPHPPAHLRQSHPLPPRTPQHHRRHLLPHRPTRPRRRIPHGRKPRHLAGDTPRRHRRQRVRTDRNHRRLHLPHHHPPRHTPRRHHHHRPTRLEHPHLRPGHPPPTRRPQRHRRALHRRRPRHPRLPPPPRPHRHPLHRRPPPPRPTHVPHRRPRQMAHRRHPRIRRPHRPPGQGPRLPHRTRRNRNRPRPAPLGHPSRRHRPRGPTRRPAHHRLPHPHHRRHHRRPPRRPRPCPTTCCPPPTSPSTPCPSPPTASSTPPHCPHPNTPTPPTDAAHAPQPKRSSPRSSPTPSASTTSPSTTTSSTSADTPSSPSS